MSCCGKEWKSKITDKCVKHPSETYAFFCTNRNCLEILCRECIKSHQDAHFSTDKGHPQICGLAEIEAFLEHKAEKEIQYEQQRSKPEFIKDIDPCQMLCKKIDQYFYGTAENKIYKQKAHLQALQHPTAAKLIQIVEKQGEYKTKNDFKENYFEFLDSILKQKEN